MSLSSWLTKTVLLTGLFFGYYFTKYSFYSESISRFQVEEMEKNLHADIMKRVIKLKLDI